MKRLLFQDFSKGYDAYLRYQHLKFWIDEQLDFDVLNIQRNEKIDISFHISETPDSHLTKNAVIQLDRKILRYRKKHTVILRVEGKEQIIQCKSFSRQNMASLVGKNFDVLIRSTDEIYSRMAVNKIKRRKVEMLTPPKLTLISTIKETPSHLRAKKDVDNYSQLKLNIYIFIYMKNFDFF